MFCRDAEDPAQSLSFSFPAAPLDSHCHGPGLLPEAHRTCTHGPRGSSTASAGQQLHGNKHVQHKLEGTLCLYQRKQIGPEDVKMGACWSSKDHLRSTTVLPFAAPLPESRSVRVFLRQRTGFFWLGLWPLTYFMLTRREPSEYPSSRERSKLKEQVPTGDKGSLLQGQCMELCNPNTQTSNYISIQTIIFSTGIKVPIHLYSTVSKTNPLICSWVLNWLCLAMCTLSHLIEVYTNSQSKFPSSGADWAHWLFRIRPQSSTPSELSLRLVPASAASTGLDTGTCVSRAHAFLLTQSASYIYRS